MSNFFLWFFCKPFFGISKNGIRVENEHVSGRAGR